MKKNMYETEKGYLLGSTYAEIADRIADGKSYTLEVSRGFARMFFLDRLTYITKVVDNAKGYKEYSVLKCTLESGFEDDGRIACGKDLEEAARRAFIMNKGITKAIISNEDEAGIFKKNDVFECEKYKVSIIGKNGKTKRLDLEIFEVSFFDAADVADELCEDGDELVINRNGKWVVMRKEGGFWDFVRETSHKVEVHVWVRGMRRILYATIMAGNRFCAAKKALKVNKAFRIDVSADNGDISIYDRDELLIDFDVYIVEIFKEGRVRPIRHCVACESDYVAAMMYSEKRRDVISISVQDRDRNVVKYNRIGHKVEKVMN